MYRVRVPVLGIEYRYISGVFIGIGTRIDIGSFCLIFRYQNLVPKFAKIMV